MNWTDRIRKNTDIGTLAAHVASVSYLCWAFRHQGMVLDADGKIGKWRY